MRAHSTNGLIKKISNVIFQFQNILQSKVNQQKGISQFKDQMQRFLLQNPDIKDNICLEKANFEDEEELRRLFPNNTQAQQVQPGVPQVQGQRKLVYAQTSPRTKSLPQKPQVLGKWENVSSNIINQSKKVGTMPSLDEFQQRLNLFRNRVEKSDIVDLIIAEKDKLLQDVALQAKRNKIRDNAIHKSIEAKVRKETGDVGYFSYRKRIQFLFRIKKAEELASEKVERQQRQKELDMKKQKTIFEKHFQGKRNQNSDDPDLNNNFKSQAAEELYKEIKKCQDDTEIKSEIINFIIKHRKKLNDEYWSKPSLLQQGTKFYSEESKEFSLLSPNFTFKKQMQGQITPDFFDKRDNIEEGNLYLLTKVNRMLDGHLMKYWKSIQETKI